MMRITGGTHRGRVLESPGSDAIRPTADKTRLAIFNMIDSRGGLIDARVMDICCGTGALALDALSRGAHQAIMVDADRQSLDLARRNAALLQLDDSCQFINIKIEMFPVRKSHDPVDLVFIDPPYHQGLVPKCLDLLLTGGWLKPHALVIAETERDGPPLSPPEFMFETEKNYGAARITLLRRN